ncbi:MAG: CDP-glucose 4,6-dehydratase [Gammaproteobacteria bacterium]|nr:CDP-glucose 4,6-dehydratase [Gammaproteobacteria bacterium]
MSGKTCYSDVLNKFKGKRVFITGHTGFKGSWLTYLLKEVGADVCGFALKAQPQSHFNALQLQNSIKHIEGDIRDAEFLQKSMQDHKSEYVFHLAAQALVKQSYKNPVDTFSTNVMGSTYLLDAVRHCRSVRSLVYITSDKCYENVEWTWGYRESDQLGGRDPYSASKAAAEIVFSAYLRSYFELRTDFGAATTRAGNVIGGGDWAIDRIIPDCIRAFSHDEAVTLRNPNATRPWQHVLEPISGYLLLATKLYDEPEKYSGSWNFGPAVNTVKTVEEVTREIIQQYGRGRLEIDASDQKQHEANLLQLNCDKASQLLGWFPQWSIDKTLESTALWYKHYNDGQMAESITRAQLEDYFMELT